MKFKHPVPALRHILASLLLFFTCVTVTQAAAFAIEKANASFDQTALSVNAKFNLSLSSAIDEALQNGVSITLMTTLDLFDRRKYIWDEHIAQWAFTQEISYHSLTGRYILSSPQSNENFSYSSLDDLLDQIETFTFQSDILGDTMPQSENGYVLQLRIFLDKASLPNPLRMMTYISPAWKAKSKVYEWSVKG